LCGWIQNPAHVLNSFDPDRALGSSIDVLSRTGIDKVYSPHIVQESLSAGWGPITYRNNTELRMAAWHWTENGNWSDPVRKKRVLYGQQRTQRNRFATSWRTLCHIAVFQPAATVLCKAPILCTGRATRT